MCYPLLVPFFLRSILTSIGTAIMRNEVTTMTTMMGISSTSTAEKGTVAVEQAQSLA
jgi:hypothetical protein